MTTNRNRVSGRAVYRLMAALAIAGCGTAALAQDRAWYAGFSRDDTNIEVWRGIGWEVGPETTGFSLNGGLRMTRHFAVDIGLSRATDLEWVEYFADFRVVPSQFETSTVFDVTALQASAVGIVPFAKNWEAYFGGGLAYSRVSGQQRVTERLGTAQVRSVSGSSVDYQYTFGLGVTVVPDWHVSLGYEFFAIDEKLLGVRDGADTTVDSFTLGFAHRFAGRPR